MNPHGLGITSGSQLVLCKQQFRSRASWCALRFIPTKSLLAFLQGRRDGKAREIPVSAVISDSSRAARVHLVVPKSPS